ncbi:MAG TPA: hypothetical protein VN048_00360 [Verrucomicrobiae bacterium]|nr:hypothetical protein [Verrucomicrobiae bacterium]
MKGERTSWIWPIAALAVTVALFLFLTKKISGACFASIMICVGLVSLACCAFMEVGAALENTASLCFQNSIALERVGQQQLTFSKDQERKNKWERVFALIGLSSGIMALAAELIRLLHGH